MKIALLSVAIAFLVAGPALADTGAPVRASSAASTRIVVPARTIARGQVISDADLSYTTVASARVFPGIAITRYQLDGKQARRVLRAGEPVRVDDVRAPILITKGSTVTVTFHAPGIQLTAIGKAMSEGGLGEAVTVLNPVSYRQITATVTGPGTAVAGDTSNTVSSDTAPAQVAAAQP